MGRKAIDPREKIQEIRIYLKAGLIEDLGGKEKAETMAKSYLSRPRVQKEPKEKPVKPTLEQLPDNCFAVKTGNGWDYSTYYGEPGKLNDFLSINKKDLIEAAGNESHLNAILKDFWKAKTFGNERYNNYGAFRKNLINYILARKNKTLTNGTEPKPSKVESIVNNFTAAQEAIKAKYGQ